MDDRASKQVRRFEDLVIWQRAISFAAEIYLITESAGLKSDFGLKDQLRRSVVSISANIAEGFERRSRNEYLNFLNIAKASAGEVRSLLEVGFRVGYLDREQLDELTGTSRFLSGSITNHMKAIASAKK